MIRRIALPLVALLALAPLTACGGNDQPAPSSSTSSATGGAETPEQSAAPQEEVSVATTPEVAVTADASATAPAGDAASLPAGVKKFATAKLPAKVGKYTGNGGMYTGGTEDDMVMMTLSNTLKFETVVGKLTDKSTVGLATCGKSQGVTACFAPLDGGVLWLNGTDQTKAIDLAHLTKDVYDTFA